MIRQHTNIKSSKGKKKVFAIDIFFVEDITKLGDKRRML